MVLNSAKNLFPRSTMTLLGSRYLVNHVRSPILDTKSAEAEGIVRISIQPIAGSIFVTDCKQRSFHFW